LIAAPERRKSHQLCHVNLLKAYHAQVSQELSPPADDAHPVCVCNTLMSGSESVCEDELPSHDSALLTGRLKNSEVLSELNSELSHLSELQRTDRSSRRADGFTVHSTQ